MAQTLLATGRITLPITVDGLLHKLRVYVKNPTASGGSYNINSRTSDLNDQLWTTAAEDLASSISYGQGVTAVSVGDAYLESRSGLIWTTLAFHTCGLNNALGTYAPGTQQTMVFRDTAGYKVKIIALEGNLNAPYHNGSYSSLTSTQLALIKQFTAAYTLTNAPYLWMVSRGNRYLNSASYVGLTIALNRKVRRRRGLT